MNKILTYKEALRSFKPVYAAQMVSAARRRNTLEKKRLIILFAVFLRKKEEKINLISDWCLPVKH